MKPSTGPSRGAFARRALLWAAAVLFAAACGGDGSDDAADGQATTAPAAASAAPAASPPDDEELFLFIIATDAARGLNRLPFALRRASGARVTASPADLRLVYSRRGGGDPRVAPEAVFRQWPLGGGIYTTTVEFDLAGLWDFTLIRQMSDRGTETATAVALVNETSSTPAIGDPAPAAPSKTGSTAEELARITSSPSPAPELYAISLDEAVVSGKPVVVTFATPAFCESQTCGPQVETLREVQLRHEGDAHFIHVELFDNPHEMLGDPGRGVESPLVEAWGLTSEPWTFVLDRQGRVAAKFEAYTTAAEIEAALEEALAGS